MEPARAKANAQLHKEVKTWPSMDSSKKEKEKRGDTWALRKAFGEDHHFTHPVLRASFTSKYGFQQASHATRNHGNGVSPH
jgi:hypothetical protein